MLSVVHLFQEVEEWMGQEEEVVAQRREVGCQWESPEEERKDVGCQSDSAARRDVAIQVDLLTQQLCGMAWRCVAVRADEPGGGALLQYCSTPRSCGHTLYNTLLPIMPLSSPASHTEPLQPESKDIQLTVPSPSMAPADASAAPPPGLIAPLSPHLAEEQQEEEEEDDEGSLKQEFSVNKQSTETEEMKKRTKRKNENPVHPTPRSSPFLQRRRRRRRSDGDKINQSEESRNIRIKTQGRRRNIQTGLVGAQRKHTTAERGKDKNMEAEKENEKVDEVMMKEKRRRRRSKEADGLSPIKKNSEVTDRPRRKAVGPPIRYLLEYEERSHQERRNRSQEVGRGTALKQLHLSVFRKGSRRRGNTVLRLHRLYSHNIRGRRRRNTSMLSGSVDEPEEEVKGKKTQVKTRRRTMEKDGASARNRSRSRRDKGRGEVMRRRRGREKLEEKLAQRPRRTMVGPPIRYLLESEEKLLRLNKANQDVARRGEGETKPQKKKIRGRALDDRAITSEVTEKQAESTNQDAGCLPKCRVGRPKKVRVDSETVGGASGVARRERQRLKIKRWCERRSADQTVKRKGLEGGEEVKKSHQRQRRMVGPPIRYLLESEKSQSQDTANRDVARETGGETKQLKKKTEAEGEAVDDRSRSTEHTERQTELTNQDAELSPKQTVGRPKKFRVDSETVGSALEAASLAGETRREGRSERRSANQMVKLEREEEEREEVKKPPQRQRRMVSPPIRYLPETETSHSQETANQDVARETRGETKPQKKKTEAEGRALDDRSKTTELTEKQTESTNQNAAWSPKRTVGRPNKVRVDSETVGGASGETRRKRLEVEKWSVRRSGDQVVKVEREEEVKEPPQRQRQTMLGPPIGNLLEKEEESHDWEVVGTSWELNLQERSQSGGVTLKQETSTIDRPEETEQKVRQAGETDTEMKTGLINQDRPKRRRRKPGKLRGQSEEGGGASEAHGTKIEGHKVTQRRRRRKRRRGTEEEVVRQVCVNDGSDEKMEEDRKETSAKRPRRTMVGPPIRYLLESEELSHGRDSTNRGSECMRKLLRGNEAGGGAGGDMEGAKHKPERPKKVRDDSETEGTAPERQAGGTDTEPQTGPYTQTHLIYFDPQSRQVTIFSPCCVQLQRL
ncbi:uncharacterized protein LOC141807745 [Halichoeres trimaculatus]|uniref:uncharacterized protein LOC141807745 n=1 Tax=Halichoeres trimaculatus TaxID=147232 RepID=UPI003D9E6FA4